MYFFRKNINQKEKNLEVKKNKYFFKIQKIQNEKKILGYQTFFGKISDFLTKIREKNLGVPKKKGYIQFTIEIPFKELFRRNSKKYKLERKKI